MAGAGKRIFGSNPQQDRPSAPNRLVTPAWAVGRLGRPAGLGTMIHALITSDRRRWRDLAILKTLGLALLHLARRCRRRIAKWSRFPSGRLSEVLKAINPGIVDDVQGLWWRTLVGVITRCNSAPGGATVSAAGSSPIPAAATSLGHARLLALRECPGLLERLARIADRVTGGEGGTPLASVLGVSGRDRGHGRVELRRLPVSNVAGFGFPHATQAICSTRQVRWAGSRTWRTVTVYAVTSLTIHKQALLIWPAIFAGTGRSGPAALRL
jgi:hypothetical protein